MYNKYKCECRKMLNTKFNTKHFRQLKHEVKKTKGKGSKQHNKKTQ